MKSFVDLAEIEVKAGDGGDGLVSFRHEKFVPKGGPDGGNGGDGGDVYIQVSAALTTLYDFTHRKKFSAENGKPGGKAERTGKSGENLLIQVPAGTIVYELKGFDSLKAHLVKIVDLDTDTKKILIAKGGKGGRGNTAFKSSTNQTPRESEQGIPGEHKRFVLELKLVADVGIIGLPNAGKSTLLSHLTAARPEIGSYPFTTLTPNLGVMEYYGQPIVLADIPGLIEGAAEGKGLGDEFLRHIERTHILVHLVDPLYEDPINVYQVIRRELREYSEKLLQKPEIVVINKMDVTEVNQRVEQITKRFKDELNLEILAVSAATGKGLNALQDQIAKVLKGSKDQEKEGIVKQTQVEEIPVYTIKDLKHFKKAYH